MNKKVVLICPYYTDKKKPLPLTLMVLSRLPNNLDYILYTRKRRNAVKIGIFYDLPLYK